MQHWRKEAPHGFDSPMPRGKSQVEGASMAPPGSAHATGKVPSYRNDPSLPPSGKEPPRAAGSALLMRYAASPHRRAAICM